DPPPDLAARALEAIASHRRAAVDATVAARVVPLLLG
ncbi:MAG: hypothetical protein JWM31_3363, partial [Solirubrobacterales bacterium]|nr:hypothetical protein [Solirubrobacterales bacterium]